MIVSRVVERFDRVVENLVVDLILTLCKGIALAALVRLAIWLFWP